MSQSGFEKNATLEESMHQLKSISTDIQTRFNAATNRIRRIPFTRDSRGSQGSMGDYSSVKSLKEEPSQRMPNRRGQEIREEGGDKERKGPRYAVDSDDQYNNPFSGQDQSIQQIVGVLSHRGACTENLDTRSKLHELINRCKSREQEKRSLSYRYNHQVLMQE